MAKKRTSTEKFLKQISEHLSGRNDCRQVEFEVNIKTYFSSVFNSVQVVSIRPEVSVYPDRNHRRIQDKTSVIDHILLFHDDEYVLEDGKYIYRLSVDKKRRKWMKISDR